MKPAFKYLFVVLVGLFLVVACGPVTPVSSATSTATITATATRRPTATATPTEVAPTPQSIESTRLLEQLPPSPPADKYELMPWTSELRSKVMKIFDDNGYDLWPGDYDELGLKYSTSFGNEAWLHAQSNDEKKAAVCSVVFEAPGSDLFRDLRLGQDLFSFFVEEMLNDEGIAIEQLTDEFRNRFGQGCLGGFSLNGTGNIYFEPAVVRNLFGNGRDAYVFAVGSIFGDNRVAIYATHAVEGSIRIERVRNWERYTSIASSTKIRLVDVGDVNANGYNELVIDVHYGGSGYPGSSAEWLYWHEWHPDVQSFVGGETINVFAHGNNVGPEVGEWSLAKANIPEAVSVTAHEFYSTRLDVCEFLTIEKTILFQG